MSAFKNSSIEYEEKGIKSSQLWIFTSNTSGARSMVKQSCETSLVGKTEW